MPEPRSSRDTKARGLLAFSLGTLLLVLASAIPVGTSASLGPPFHPYYTVATSTASSTPCAAARATIPPAWVSSHGKGTLGGLATATSCARTSNASGRVSLGAWSGIVYVYLPLTLHGNASRAWINASLSMAWAGTLAVSVGAWCSGTPRAHTNYRFLLCSIGAAVSFQVVGFVADLSTGAYYPSTNASFPSVYRTESGYRYTFCTPRCSTTNASASGGGNFSSTQNATLGFVVPSPNATHTWYLFLYETARVSASVTTSMSDFTGVTPLLGAARAKLDLGSAHEGVTLTGVIVS